MESNAARATLPRCGTEGSRDFSHPHIVPLCRCRDAKISASRYSTSRVVRAFRLVRKSKKVLHNVKAFLLFSSRRRADRIAQLNSVWCWKALSLLKRRIHTFFGSFVRQITRDTVQFLMCRCELWRLKL